jgi:hypothetical protein
MEIPTLKDSGERHEFTTGAVRDTSKGKGRYDLIPPEAIEAIALQMEAGAAKYQARNWEKGIPVSRFIDSGLRHTFRYLEGRTDEDHLVSALWNFSCAIATRERCKRGTLPPELNDIPPCSMT